MNQQQCNDLALQSLQYTVRHYVSMPAIWVRKPEWARQHQYLVEEGLEKVKQTSEHHGVIVLFLHYGNWETQCIHLTDIFPNKSVTVLAKDKMDYGELVNKMRIASRPHGLVEPANERGVRKLFRALKKKQVVTFSPDHVPGSDKGSIVAPFFGVPAKTMTLLYQLLQKTDAKVFIGVSDLVEDDSAGYRIRYLDVNEAIYSDDEYTSVCALNRSIEGVIIENPKEYTWWYKRFRGL